MKTLDFRKHLRSVCKSETISAALVKQPHSAQPECRSVLCFSPSSSQCSTSGFQCVDLGGQVLLLVVNCVRCEDLAHWGRLCHLECGPV